MLNLKINDPIDLKQNITSVDEGTKTVTLFAAEILSQKTVEEYEKCSHTGDIVALQGFSSCSRKLNGEIYSAFKQDVSETTECRVLLEIVLDIHWQLSIEGIKFN